MRAVPRRVVAAVVIALVCALPPASQVGLSADDDAAEVQTASVQYGEFLSVKPGKLRGTVLYSDGKTPAAKVPVRVWSVEHQKLVIETNTDEDGAYELSELADGRYFAIFGDRVSVDLRVDEEAELVGGPLNVIIPRGTAVFAQMAPEQQAAVLSLLGQTGVEGAAAAGTPLKTMLIVGGGAATAVGAIVVVDNVTDDDTKVIVSP